MEQMAFDARAWLVWVLSAAAVTMIVRNPLYTLILLLVSRIVDAACSRPHSDLQLPFWRIAGLILLFSGLFSAHFIHQGDLVLLRLPSGWPLVGGPITVEALAAGAANGLLLLTLLSFFVAFNRIVPVSALARLAPRAFQDLGVVVLISLTYVPETVRHMRRIREAQAVRGHQVRGLRDWQPLVVPLLVGGMERAMALAEAMVSRGFGAARGRRQPPWVLAGLAAALVFILAGWVLLLWWGWPGWMLLIAGAASIVALLWHAGKRAPATRYRPRPWQTQDTLLLLAALLPLGLSLFPLPAGGREALFWSALPRLTWPPFDPLLGVAFLLLAIPAVAGRPQRRTAAREGRYDIH